MRLRPTTYVALLLSMLCGNVQAESIKVVTEDSFYHYLQDGKVDGPASRVVEAMLQRAGLSDYSMALYPWARAYKMALEQPNILIYLIARTPEREPLLKWIGQVINAEYHAYKLRGQPDIQARTLADLKRYSIGVIRDDFRHQYLQAKGFNKLVVTAENDNNLGRLLNGQVQLIVLAEPDARKWCADMGVDFASLEQVYTLDELGMPLYMAYSNTTEDEIVARSRAALESLKSEGLLTQLMNTNAEPSQ